MSETPDVETSEAVEPEPVATVVETKRVPGYNFETGEFVS